MNTRASLVLTLAVLLGGCAGTRMMTPQTAPWVHAEARQRMHQPIPDPRNITLGSDQLAVVERIDNRVLPAAIQVCRKSFRDSDEECERLLRGRTLDVRSDDNSINAFVGYNYDVTLLGGLISAAGSDDEIAAVLAHEYSHALLRHPQKAVANRLGGMLIGAAVGAAVGAKKDDSRYVRLGAEAGVTVGSLVFSRSMELAADHFGLFIMHEAGYDVRAAAQFHIRMARLASSGSSTNPGGFLGFLSTHPPPERRVDKLIAAEEMISSGARRPIWKKQ